MPKYNTKSRIELAHLKRQLETRKKQYKLAHDEPPVGYAPKEEKETVAASSGTTNPPPPPPDTRFDYKFVFTNSAMKMEDKVFRVKNPGVAFERDMKVVKPMAATTSFLPYGVTIRNPHMFEEDQLAVIQRRQEVHNIGANPAPYNPFVSHDSTKSLASSTTLSPRGSRLPEGVPRILNRYSGSRTLRSAEGKMSSLARKPLINYLSSAMSTDGSSHSMGSRSHGHHHQHQHRTSTNTRDSEFREKFHALEARRAKQAGNEEAHFYHLKRERSQQNNKVIDKLSSTVQQLNKYEERLKHYLKSKNTMIHAGAALKQLRFKRSKTVAQLSKLTAPEDPLAKNRSPRHKEDKRITFTEEPAPPSATSDSSKRKNQSSPRTTPKHSRNPSPTPREHPNNQRRQDGANFRSSQLEGKKLSSVIGNKIISMQQQGRAVPNQKTEDDKMTPLQAAMIEGIELEKLSTVLTHAGPEQERRKRDFVQPPGTVAPGPTPRAGRTLPADQQKAALEDSTVSIFRYRQQGQPPEGQSQFVGPASYVGRDLVDVPKYTSTYENHARLFASTTDANGLPNQLLENKRSSEVIRRVYQDFQLHQDTVQAELLRDRSRKTKKNLHASNRAMAQLSEMMKEKAHSQRQLRVPH